MNVGFRVAVALAMSLEKANKVNYGRPSGFWGHYIGTTGTSRTHPNNVANKHRAFEKRVAKRRAKKGYA